MTRQNLLQYVARKNTKCQSPSLDTVYTNYPQESSPTTNEESEG